MSDDSEKEEFLNVGDVPKLTDIIAQMAAEHKQNMKSVFPVKHEVKTGWNGNDDEIKLLPQHLAPQPNFMMVTVPQEILDEMAKNKLSPEEKARLDDVFSKVLKKKKESLLENLIKDTPGLHKLKEHDDLIEPIVDSKHDMWWHPKNGKKVLASQMETSHLFFSLRLLFNQVCPPNRRIATKSQVKAQASVQGDLQTKHAIKVLFHQLAKRDDLTDEQFITMQYMAKILREEVP